MYFKHKQIINYTLISITSRVLVFSKIYYLENSYNDGNIYKSSCIVLFNTYQ